MQIEFTNGGVRYNLVIRTKSRREAENAAEIAPDPNLYSSARQKRRIGAQRWDEEDDRNYAQSQRKNRQMAWRKFWAGGGRRPGNLK